MPDLPSLPEDGKLEVQRVSETQVNELVNLEPENSLDQHSFSLPTCRISESVKKLMELAYQTLVEATTSSDQWYDSELSEDGRVLAKCVSDYAFIKISWNSLDFLILLILFF